MPKLLLLLGLGLIGTLAFAQARAESSQTCPQEILDAVGTQLHVDHFHYNAPPDDTTDGVVLDAACKPWPADHHALLAAVAYHKPSEVAKDGLPLDHLFVAMLDAKTYLPISSTVSSLEEDALTSLGEGSLQIDTAQYDLAPGVRAFGVILYSHALGGCGDDGGFNDDMILYVRKGRALKPVLNTYLNYWNRVSGAGCGDGRNNVIDETKLSIAVEKTRSHGYADLLISAKVERTDKSDSNARTRVMRSVVHFDGRRYPFEQIQVNPFWETRP